MVILLARQSDRCGGKLSRHSCWSESPHRLTVSTCEYPAVRGTPRQHSAHPAPEGGAPVEQRAASAANLPIRSARPWALPRHEPLRGYRSRQPQTALWLVATRGSHRGVGVRGHVPYRILSRCAQAEGIRARISPAYSRTHRAPAQGWLAHRLRVLASMRLRVGPSVPRGRQRLIVQGEGQREPERRALPRRALHTDITVGPPYNRLPDVQAQPHSYSRPALHRASFHPTYTALDHPWYTRS